VGDTQFMKDRATLEAYVGPNRHESGVGPAIIYEDTIDAIRRVTSIAGALERELVDMVNQHCLRRDDGSIFAGGLSANADAMRLLAELGVIKITGGEGRCIYGEWDGWMKESAHAE
jgi:hypothetical protein